MTSSREHSALVIGGASGIGAAVVEIYRARDVPTTVWDVAGTYDVRCDIAEPEAIDRALRETLEARGNSTLGHRHRRHRSFGASDRDQSR